MKAGFLTVVLVSFLCVILVPTVGTPALSQNSPGIDPQVERIISELHEQNRLLQEAIQHLLAGVQPSVQMGPQQPLPPGPGQPMQPGAQPRPPQGAPWQSSPPQPQPPIGPSYNLTVEATRFEGDAAQPVLTVSTVVATGREFHFQVGFEHAAPAEQGSQPRGIEVGASLELGGLCAPRDDGGITLENLHYEMASQMSAGQAKGNARLSGNLTMPIYPGARTIICVLGLPGDGGKPGASIQIQAVLSEMVGRTD